MIFNDPKNELGEEMSGNSVPSLLKEIFQNKTINHQPELQYWTQNLELMAHYTRRRTKRGGGN